MWAGELRNHLRDELNTRSILHAFAKPQMVIDRFEVGQSLSILPAHSCLAAEVDPRYVTTDGQEVERFRLHG